VDQNPTVKPIHRPNATMPTHSTNDVPPAMRAASGGWGAASHWDTLRYVTRWNTSMLSPASNSRAIFMRKEKFAKYSAAFEVKRIAPLAAATRNATHVTGNTSLTSCLTERPFAVNPTRRRSTKEIEPTTVASAST